MTTTLIITCSQCGHLLLAKADQKTRTCPHCDSQVFVAKAKRIASAENAIQASIIIRKLKSEAATNRY